MAGGFSVKIEGLRELDKALGELPKATGKNVLRRILKKRAEPVAIDAASRAPVLTGELGLSIDHGPKLSGRQKALHRKMMSSAAVEWFIGPSTEGRAAAVAQAVVQEFGTWFHRAQPFMRPAWDAHQHSILEHFKDDLWTEISKSAARQARKAARQARA